jgi:filamentous hemagglutinin
LQDSAFTNNKNNVLMQSERLDETRTASTLAMGSTVTSLAGNVSLQAGNSFFQIGSDVFAPNGDVSIAARNVSIKEARETLLNQQRNSYSESGVTAGVTNPLVTAAQSIQKLDNAAHQTNDKRMTTMAIASAALTTSQAIDAVKASPETFGGVSLNAGLANTSATSTSNYQSDKGKASEVIAGGDIHISASGAKDASNLTIQGSQIQAKGTTTLKTDGAITLQASQNTSTFDQTSTFSTSNAGVVIHSNAGVGATTGFSSGQGQAHATDHTFTNTHINGQTVSIQSGGDTSLEGAVISANQISANVGGNLVITSKQDMSAYQSSEQSRGMGAVVPIGAGVYGGSTSSSKTNIVSEYANVTEQSAIRAGDGGFNVNVAGNTTLKGGAITSTQKALDTNSNSFISSGTVSLINADNKAHFQADSVAISAGVTGAGEVTQPLNSVGIGSKSGNVDNTTLAAITGVLGNLHARTGDAQTGISKIFDASSVRADVQSQVTITSEFGKQASKAVGDYADSKLRDAIAQGNQANIDDWKEGGTARLSLHALVGGLTGNLSGAAGAIASQSFVPIVGNTLNSIDIPIEVKQAIVLAAGTTVGSAIGGTAGAASSYNATSNNYLTHAEDMQRNALRKAQNANNCDKTCEEDLTLLDAIDESRDSEIQNVISLCRKVRTANNCLAVARHYADVNGYGFASAKYESVGRTGSPFSFNGYLVNKGTDDEHYEVPQIKLPNGTTKPDPGGFSYGMFQLSAKAGGMEEFLKLLKNPDSSREAKGFYNELIEAGGLEAARNGDKQFVNKFMELTQRDPQFIEYQFESINQTGLKKHIIGGLRDLGYEFNDLEPMEKEALFSVVVQNGGLGAYRAASYVVRGSYFQKKMEYMFAIRDGKKLAESGDALINMKIDLLLSKDNASPQKLLDIESELSVLNQKINIQKEKIIANANFAEGLRDWSKVSGPIGPLDDEGFIIELYDWRIKSRPTEAASRYRPERDMLLKMLRESNEQKAKHPK